MRDAHCAETKEKTLFLLQTNRNKQMIELVPVINPVDNPSIDKYTERKHANIITGDKEV